MSADLRWAIQSLLRPRKQSTMGPPKARDPIPARLGVADWGQELQYTAPPVVISAIDHGWLAYTSPTLPASIYADTTLASYLAGTGTAIPGGSETDHLIGPMATDAGRSCQPGHDGIDWTAPPTLDGAAKYDSFAWASAAPANTYAVPHRHSGLGVAFGQALLGAGRKFADILPSGWSYDPTKISLVRGPDRSYWLTKTDTNGCLLTKLDLPEAYYCLDYWLANDLLTAYSADLCLAIVLGNLTLPESPTIYEAVSSAAMAAVWADSAYDMPGWGWQWTDQRQNAVDEVAPKAILVTIYEVNPTSYSGLRCVSRTCRLTLNWDGSNLPTTATLDITASGQWRLNEFYLKVFRLNAAEDTLSRYDPQGGITFVTLDVEGPFAAWYAPDGSEIIAKWSGVDNYAGVSENWENPADYVCGLGSVVRSTYRIWNGSLAKKISLTVGPNSIDHYYAWGVAEGVYSYTAGDSGGTDVVPGTATVTGCDGQIVTCNNEEGDTWTLHFLDNTAGGNTYALLDAKSENTFESGRLIVAFGSPRTIWAQEEIISGGGTWAKHYQYPQGQSQWQAIHSKGCTVPLISSYDGLFYWTDDTARNTSGTTDAGSVYQSQAAVFLGDQMATLDDTLAWWDTLWGLSGSGSTPQVPLALVSRGGLAAYMDAPGSSPTWTMPTGISLSAPGGTVHGWVGGL